MHGFLDPPVDSRLLHSQCPSLAADSAPDDLIPELSWLATACRYSLASSPTWLCNAGYMYAGPPRCIHSGKIWSLFILCF